MTLSDVYYNISMFWGKFTAEACGWFWSLKITAFVFLSLAAIGIFILYVYTNQEN